MLRSPTLGPVTSPEEFTAAGLYDPESDATTGRLELLHWLAEFGFTVEEMRKGLEVDSLGAMVGDRLLVPGERLTRAEAIEIAGIGERPFDENVTAFGLQAIAGAPPGEVGITHEEAEAIGAFNALGEMFTDDETVSFLRVVGASLSRIADAGVSLFLADVESRMVLDGSSQLELAQSVERGTRLMDGFAQRLDPILRRQMLQAIERSRRTMINPTERFVYRYALGFVDLVGFTSISRDMHARELSEFLRDFEGRAYDVVTGEGARVVKLIGDEVMFAASDAAAACRAGNALMRGFGEAHEQVFPRGGIAYGDVLVRGGDYYGAVVNLASRLVDEAVPLEMLVTEPLADAAVGCSFEPAGRRMVKGFSEPISVRSLLSD